MLDGGSDDDLPPEERARRERAREQAGGIVAYATDRAGRRRRLRAVGARLRRRTHPGRRARRGCSTRPAPSSTPDRTRPAPGSRTSAAARCTSTTSPTATTAVLAAPEGTTVTYGLADFVAAEEMNRMRGYWWSPDGRSLLVARVDDAPVRRWYIADPANPDREPTVVAYPAAGTPNALVSLVVVGLDGTRVDVAWDAGARRVPGARRVVRGGTADRGPAARPARAARAAGRPGHRRHRRSCTRTPTAHWVEIVPGVPGPHGVRRAAVDHRRRGRAPPARRRRTGHPADPAGPRRARRRRGHRAAQRLRRPGLDRAVDLVRRGRAAVPHPGARCARRAAGRRDARREHGSRSTPTARSPPSGRRAGSSGRSPRSPSRPGWRRGSPCTAPASGRCAPRCCSRRGTSRGRRCRCSWTPTAARTPSASSPPAART